MATVFLADVDNGLPHHRSSPAKNSLEQLNVFFHHIPTSTYLLTKPLY